MSCLYLTIQGSKLRKIAGRYVITRRDEELAAMPGCMVEAVLLFGQVQVTSRAAHSLLEEGVPLLYLTRSGGFRGVLQPGYPKNAEVRLAQYEASTDSNFALLTARAVVEAKISRSIQNLRAWTRNRWNPGVKETIGSLEGSLSRLQFCERVPEVRALEALAAKDYFSAFGDTLPPPFSWQGRNRQPPQDPVNAMLSMGYMLLLGRAIAACYSNGLDSQVGFLHQLEYGRPSLALDLLEPYRARVDHFIMRGLQREEWVPEDFTYSRENGCRFSGDALQRFLSGFHAWLQPEENVKDRLCMAKLARELRKAIGDRRMPEFVRILEESP